MGVRQRFSKSLKKVGVSPKVVAGEDPGVKTIEKGEKSMSREEKEKPARGTHALTWWPDVEESGPGREGNDVGGKRVCRVNPCLQGTVYAYVG